MLEVLRRQNKAPPPDWRIERLIAAHAPEVERTAVAYAEAQHASYRGKAAACLDINSRSGGSVDADIAAVRAALGANDARQSPSPSATGPSATGRRLCAARGSCFARSRRTARLRAIGRSGRTPARARAVDHKRPDREARHDAQREAALDAEDREAVSGCLDPLRHKISVVQCYNLRVSEAVKALK